MMIRIALILSLFTVPALAQVRVHPTTVAPGQPIVVEIDAVFPDPCQLDGDITTRREPGRLEIEFLPVQAACTQVVTALDRSFGPFQLEAVEPGSSVTVSVLAPSGLVGEADLAIESPVADAFILSGLYWDPALVGLGVTVAAEGSSLFLAAYAYGPQGAPVWHVGQGELSGASMAFDLLRVTGGPCLVCGPQPGTPDAPIRAGAATLVVAGPARAFLAIGDSPAPVIDLQPLGQRLVQSEGTIAGETFTLPDLSGRWLFTDGQGELAFTTDLAQRPTGISDSGMAWFESADESVRVECGLSPDSDYRCLLRVDGVELGQAESSGISYNAIRSDSLLGFRIE